MRSNATVSRVGKLHIIRATLADIASALTWGKTEASEVEAMHANPCSLCPKSDWYGGYSHDEFRSLMRNGDSSLVTDILAELDIAISDEAPRYEIARAQVGFYPCVPAHLAGQPDAMYQLRMADSPQRKAITLFYNVGFSAGTNSDTVRQYGFEVMKIVNQLNAERVAVNLYGYVYCSVDRGSTCALTIVEVQRSQDVFTPERIAATLPSSFCRRGIFGLWEHMGYANGDKIPLKMARTNYGTHNKELQIDALKAALPDLDTDSIILVPEVSVHVNPSQIWEPINLKLNRST